MKRILFIGNWFERGYKEELQDSGYSVRWVLPEQRGKILRALREDWDLIVINPLDFTAENRVKIAKLLTKREHRVFVLSTSVSCSIPKAFEEIPGMKFLFLPVPPLEFVEQVRKVVSN